MYFLTVSHFLLPVVLAKGGVLLMTDCGYRVGVGVRIWRLEGERGYALSLVITFSLQIPAGVRRLSAFFASTWALASIFLIALPRWSISALTACDCPTTGSARRARL